MAATIRRASTFLQNCSEHTRETPRSSVWTMSSALLTVPCKSLDLIPNHLDVGDLDVGLTQSIRFAGSDSTASTMQSFFYCILNHPSVYKNLTEEINKAQKAGQLSEIVTYAEALKLDYFQACLKEAMRIRPAVGLGIYRNVPTEGIEIGGKFYPGGTQVAVNGWVLHRDKTVFGDDVEVYRPERWFERDAKFMGSHLYQVRLHLPNTER